MLSAWLVEGSRVCSLCVCEHRAMDPPAMMRDGAFSDGNAASFSLSEIWRFPGGSGGQVGKSLSQFINAANREVSGDDLRSSVVEQHGGGRKRRDLDDDSAKVVSTSSGNGGNDYDGKLIKNSGCKDEYGDSKGEAELSSGKTAEPNNQLPEPPKQDYIHVRARRGQATDSHSLAERARREKISERMKILQDLVPGCNKVIGKALVLDEIINYIQSLQRQVEFLSMKLEAVNSRMTPNIEIFPPKEFGQQTYDAAGVAFGSQASREYVRGSSPEWLHMQVGGGFERAT